MAGIEFDRQVFATTVEPPRRLPLPLQALGPALFVLALGVIALIGYKIYHDNFRPSTASSTAEVEQLRQQLSDVQKRLDQVEKHRRTVQSDAAADPATKPLTIPKGVAVPKPVYRVGSASKLPAVASPGPTIPLTASSSSNSYNPAVQDDLEANHEAWQATTDRLADVVGVVGTQQGEISETRATLNQLLAQSKRRAVTFELQRSNSRMPVGPLTLQLKAVDRKAQRYSVCVYLDEKCIELKDRALNEVVIFSLAKDSVPLELVATKIMRTQILGYVEVPMDGRSLRGADR
jgi:prefoldin subunit 5